MEKKIYIGVAYYPEQWPEDRWETDARLMREAGINVARLAEFGWSLMEPSDGTFDFSLFDRAIDVLWNEGIQIVLGTPTMVPPVWMWKKYPDMVTVDETGLKKGGRSRYCANHPEYIKYTKRFVRKMAEHYKDHPAVIAWQIDNEFNGHRCCCKHCSEAFREWLGRHYQTLENLNNEWGTVFWSQVYNSWDEVDVPTQSEMITTVSQQLDFKRFSSDSRVNFQGIQAGIIREICPSHQLTHNGMGLYPLVNYFDIGKELDFYSWDTYPAVDGDNLSLCLSHDLSRGVKQKSFWVMEQKNGYLNYSSCNLAIEPGIVRLWSYRDIARGADGVVFFRWRSGRYGREQHPQGLLRHDGSKRRAYFEVKQLAEEMRRIGNDIAGSEFAAQAAMLWSYDQIWAFETHIQNEKFSYQGLFEEYYDAVAGFGVNVDVISPYAELGQYKMVVAPALFVLDEKVAKNLESYVKNGGTLILTVRSGVRTWSNVTVDTPWPGLLHEITGATVVEFDSLPSNMSNTVEYKGKDYQVGCFLDILECGNAKCIAAYSNKFYKGQAAVTSNVYDKGRVIYCGAMGSTELLRDIFKDVCNETGVTTFHWPEGVEVTWRRSGGTTYMFVLNGTFEDKQIALEKEYTDLISNKKVAGMCTINKLDAMVLVEI